MRGLRSKLLRRLRLLLACLVLTLAVAPPLVGVAPAAAALVSQGAQSPARGSACERAAPEASAHRHVPVRWNEERAALFAERAPHASSREAAFDGRRLYLRHLALLC